MNLEPFLERDEKPADPPSPNMLFMSLAPRGRFTDNFTKCTKRNRKENVGCRVERRTGSVTGQEGKCKDTSEANKNKKNELGEVVR